VLPLPGLALGARPLFCRHDNDAARPLSIKAGVYLGRVPPAAIEERVGHPPGWNIKGTCRKAEISFADARMVMGNLPVPTYWRWNGRNGWEADASSGATDRLRK
jgi:hypothetical protein